MIITAIKPQIRDDNRVSVFIDNKYKLSLTIEQLAEVRIKVGQELSDLELASLTQQSDFGKLYFKTLHYSLSRPHSSKEIRTYLSRQTRPRLGYGGKSGKVYSIEVADLVFERLVNKGYIDDEKFTKYWVENRSLKKGISERKLRAELRLKGIDSGLVDRTIGSTERNDSDEIKKLIVKKQARYQNPIKLKQYLARQGFRYDDIEEAMK